MKRISLLAALPFLLQGTLFSAPPGGIFPGVFPNEKLDYSINWPSGLSLGEAHWKAQNTGSAASPAWDLSFYFDARIPGFALINHYESFSTAAYCTQRLTRDIQHGARRTGEIETIDPKTLIASRKFRSGDGESKITVPDCVKDALSFLFLTRHELVSGRIPPAQTILFGASYQVKLTYLGTHKVESGGHSIQADRVGCAIQGPASNVTAEVDFAQDAVRTPLAVRIPISLGTISLELVR